MQVVYVSGREAQQEPAPAHCFTPKDLATLVTPLVSNSKFKGVDILLTSQWPQGVWQYGNSPASPFCVKHNMISISICRRLSVIFVVFLFQDIDTKFCGVSSIGNLAEKLKPRYHFAGMEGVYYERLPYRCGHLMTVFLFIFIIFIPEFSKEFLFYI